MNYANKFKFLFKKVHIDYFCHKFVLFITILCELLKKYIFQFFYPCINTLTEQLLPLYLSISLYV